MFKTSFIRLICLFLCSVSLLSCVDEEQQKLANRLYNDCRQEIHQTSRGQVEESIINEFCECSLNKVKALYKDLNDATDEAISLDSDLVMAIEQDCISIINPEQPTDN